MRRAAPSTRLTGRAPIPAGRRGAMPAGHARPPAFPASEAKFWLPANRDGELRKPPGLELGGP
eukprot:750930-Hanusia_phi.AAC.8